MQMEGWTGVCGTKISGSLLHNRGLQVATEHGPSVMVRDVSLIFENAREGGAGRWDKDKLPLYV